MKNLVTRLARVLRRFYVTLDVLIETQFAGELCRTMSTFVQYFVTVHLSVVF